MQQPDMDEVIRFRTEVLQSTVGTVSFVMDSLIEVLNEADRPRYAENLRLTCIACSQQAKNIVRECQTVLEHPTDGP